jgi:ssDNA-specific exonuclease RecJ
MPRKKFNLYKKIHRALKPKGKYIEADYVVSIQKEMRILAELQNYTDSKDLLDGSYHIDIPMSIDTLKALLSEGGFAKIDIIWQLGESVVLEAGGSNVK